MDDLSHQPPRDTVITGQESVALEEAFPAFTAVAALPKVQKGFSSQRNVFDGLYPVVVYTICDRTADRTNMLLSGQLEIDVAFPAIIFHICHHNIFQIQQFCDIILIEHRDFSFVVIGGTFMIKDFSSMLNFFDITLGPSSALDPNIYYRT